MSQPNIRGLFQKSCTTHSSCKILHAVDTLNVSVSREALQTKCIESFSQITLCKNVRQWPRRSTNLFKLCYKKRATTVSKLRKVVLMILMLKIFIWVIHRRTYKKYEEINTDTQFSFHKGMWTREALLAMRLLLQQCYNHQQDLFFCFVYYEKAFETMKRKLLLKILSDAGVDGKDVRIIKNRYWWQGAEVKL